MIRRPTVLLALLVLASTPALAQSTGTPVYAAPYRAFANGEFGVSLSDPGHGSALEGSYRTGFSDAVDVGWRAGIGDQGNTSSLLLGSDARIRLTTHTERFPFDGSFTVGLGMSSADNGTFGFLPIGFTMGRRILVEGSQVSLVPYLHPVLTPQFGDGDGTLFSLGFGLDARVTPRLDLRFSAAIGDQDGIAFTVAFLR
jgi:hypothetical protein